MDVTSHETCRWYEPCHSIFQLQHQPQPQRFNLDSFSWAVWVSWQRCWYSSNLFIFVTEVEEKAIFPNYLVWWRDNKAKWGYSLWLALISSLNYRLSNIFFFRIMRVWTAALRKRRLDRPLPSCVMGSSLPQWRGLRGRWPRNVSWCLQNVRYCLSRQEEDQDEDDFVPLVSQVHGSPRAIPDICYSKLTHLAILKKEAFFRSFIYVLWFLVFPYVFRDHFVSDDLRVFVLELF